MLEEREEIVTSLYAISIVSKKLAKQLLMDERKAEGYWKDESVKRDGGKISVKNENVDRNQRRSRKSCN